MTFEVKIKEVFLRNNISLTNEQIDKFKIYYNLLTEWNKKFNLTSILDEEDVLKKHFLDSAVACKFLKDTSYVLDIGAGAGFPSIPLKILNPSLKIILVDSVNKKVNFLNEVINSLDLKSVTAIHTRIEDLAHKDEYREKFDYVVARAVAQLNTLSEYSLPFLKINGKTILYKSDDIDEELKKSIKGISLLGGKIEKIEEVYFEDFSRKIVFIDKINNTPKKYPRSGNKPRTNPL